MKHLSEKFGLPENEEEFWSYCLGCLDNIATIYNIRNTALPEINIFNFITSKQNPNYFNAWKVSDSKSFFELCLVSYEIVYFTASHTGGHKHTDSHLYFFGHLNLTTDFGNALIRPETLEDKITELFDSVEIDFKTYPKFSKKYFVLAENKDDFAKLLKPELIQYIQNIEGLQIEFKNNNCIFRLGKAVDERESMQLCEIGLTLDGLLNNR